MKVYVSSFCAMSRDGCFDRARVLSVGRVHVSLDAARVDAKEDLCTEARGFGVDTAGLRFEWIKKEGDGWECECKEVDMIVRISARDVE